MLFNLTVKIVIVIMHAMLQKLHFLNDLARCR